jgi:hypothetical protein
MTKRSLILLVLFISVGSCREKSVSPPEKPTPSISLSVVSALSNEVWLKLSTPDSAARQIRVTCNDRIFFDGVVQRKDTFLLRENLLPKQSYAFRAFVVSGTTPNDYSTEVTSITMDTTSHDFVWTITEHGTAFNNALYGIAKLSDTDIVAVGAMGEYDSVRNFSSPRCIARWNRREWKTLPLYYNNQYGNGFVRDVRDIISFSPTENWLAGYAIFFWNGRDSVSQIVEETQRFTPRYILSEGESIIKLWGTSSRNLFGIGTGGVIVHYDGQTWRKMASGTTVNLTSISGSPDGKEVWVCGYDLSNGQSVLLRLQNGAWQTVWSRNGSNTFPFYIFFSGVWVDNIQVVTTGDRIFRHSLLNFSSVRRDTLDVIWFPRAGLAGSAPNNLLIGGDFGSLWHWNGYSWRNFPQLISDDNRIRGMAIFENEVFAVGIKYTGFSAKGVVFYGRTLSP